MSADQPKAERTSLPLADQLAVNRYQTPLAVSVSDAGASDLGERILRFRLQTGHELEIPLSANAVKGIKQALGTKQ